MSKKPFSKELYDADDNAKHLVVDFLNKRDLKAFINPDDYGIDVLAERDNKQWGYEVEVKHNWKGTKFPFKTVHIAGRKMKFAAPNTYLCMLNHERTHMLLIKGSDILEAQHVTKDTIYSMNERFIEIPFHLCRIYEL